MSTLTDPRLQQIADAIEAYVAEHHGVPTAGQTSWTPAEAEAWLRLCVAHDAVTQADQLLAGCAAVDAAPVGPHDVHLLPNHPDYRGRVTCRACGAPSRPSIERSRWEEKRVQPPK